VDRPVGQGEGRRLDDAALTAGRAPLALYCFDGSADSRAACERAAALLGGHRAVVLCVFESILSLPVGGGGLADPEMMPPEDAEEVDAAARARALDLAREGCELLGRLGIGAEPAAAEGLGSVWRTILAAADERDADVTVLGSRGLTGVRSLVLGSVSHGVANHSRRPVLIVPTESE
jgi:nucleotide-binding universal stress UspA family protein